MTGAAIDVPRAAILAAPDCLTGVSVASVTEAPTERRLGTWPEPMEGVGTRASTDQTPAYDRPPLHGPMGSTYGDVGMPYPVPDIAVVVPQAHSPRSASPSQPPQFFETSFAAPSPPAPGETAFPGTTFGPPVPASTAFLESTFERDAGD
jgi:hypothetical protein